MEQFFIWFGMLCLFFACFGIAVWGAGCYRSFRNDNLYGGLRIRIMETIDGIGRTSSNQDHFTAKEVKDMLRSLYQGYWPDTTPLSVKNKEHEPH